MKLRTEVVPQSKSEERMFDYEVRIVDIDLSIGCMVNLMLKWTVAAIPAALIIGTVVFLLMAIVGVFGGVGR